MVWVRIQTDYGDDPAFMDSTPDSVLSKLLWPLLLTKAKSNAGQIIFGAAEPAAYLLALFRLGPIFKKSDLLSALEHLRRWGLVTLSKTTISIAKWTKYQEDPTNADRQARHREAHKVTGSNGSNGNDRYVTDITTTGQDTTDRSPSHHQINARSDLPRARAHEPDKTPSDGGGGGGRQGLVSTGGEPPYPPGLRQAAEDLGVLQADLNAILRRGQQSAAWLEANWPGEHKAHLCALLWFAWAMDKGEKIKNKHGYLRAIILRIMASGDYSLPARQARREHAETVPLGAAVAKVGVPVPPDSPADSQPSRAGCAETRAGEVLDAPEEKTQPRAPQATSGDVAGLGRANSQAPPQPSPAAGGKAPS